MNKYLFRMKTNTVWDAWIEAESKEEAQAKADKAEWEWTDDMEIVYVYKTELLKEGEDDAKV